MAEIDSSGSPSVAAPAPTSIIAPADSTPGTTTEATPAPADGTPGENEYAISFTIDRDLGPENQDEFLNLPWTQQVIGEEAHKRNQERGNAIERIARRQTELLDERGSIMREAMHMASQDPEAFEQFKNVIWEPAYYSAFADFVGAVRQMEGVKNADGTLLPQLEAALGGRLGRPIEIKDVLQAVWEIAERAGEEKDHAARDTSYARKLKILDERKNKIAAAQGLSTQTPAPTKPAGNAVIRGTSFNEVMSNPNLTEEEKRQWLSRRGRT